LSHGLGIRDLGALIHGLDADMRDLGAESYELGADMRDLGAQIHDLDSRQKPRRGPAATSAADSS
jgi:hypothetical protein